MSNKVKVPGGAFYLGDGLTVDPVTRTVIAGGGDVTTPDWNQNDETASDYIKNRPFYTGDPVENVLVEESTVTFSNMNGTYLADFPSAFEATIGETYTVSWDGTVYECTCVIVQGDLVIGNLSIVDAGSDTGEPFFMNVFNGEAIEIYTTDTSASHTFSISGTVAPVVKIDRKYLPIPFKPKGESYLTFSSPSSFTLEVDKTKGWDGTLEYFASDGTWTTWDGRSGLSAVYDYGEYVLYLRGTGNTGITPNGNKWVLTGTDIMCIGNIETLLDYTTVESGEHPSMANSCYYSMFDSCTSLIQAPELPATTLALGCYNSMFSGCTNLTKAPALPATTLANDCYERMFQGCTSLKLSSTQTDEYTQEYRIPSSGDGTTAKNALSNMFTSTGGTFTETPSINTTYYLSSDNIVVRETDIATLNGYVGSMIDAAIDKYECIISSSTPGSTKKFKITVDDNGTISATEVT